MISWQPLDKSRVRIKLRTLPASLVFTAILNDNMKPYRARQIKDLLKKMELEEIFPLEGTFTSIIPSLTVKKRDDMTAHTHI